MTSREVLKAGWVKLKTTENACKSESEAMQWLVFCVHSEKVPLLESYMHPKEVAVHSPFRVIDLLDCAYVIRTVGDDCRLSVGFEHEDRLPMEMVTVSLEEREGWVQALTEKLCSMGCMNVPANLYSAFPRAASVNEDYLPVAPTGCQQIPSPAEAPSPAECTSYEVLRPLSITLPNLEEYLIPESVVESRRSCSTISNVCEQHAEQNADAFSYEVTQNLQKPPLPPRDSQSGHSPSILAPSRCPFADDCAFPSDSVAYDVPPSSGCTTSVPSVRVSADESIPLCASEAPLAENSFIHVPESSTETFPKHPSESSTEVGSRLSGDASRKSSTSSGQSSQASISSFYKSLPKEKQRVQKFCPNTLREPCASHSSTDAPASEHFGTNQDDSIPPVPAGPPPMLPPKSLLSMLRVSLREQEVMKLKTEVQSHHGLKLSLAVADLLRIAFVDVAGFLWISGWQTSELGSQLRSFVHLGDRVMAVDGVPVDSEAQIRSFMTSSFALERKCEVVIKRMPMAKIFLFKRSHDGECVGLTLRKGKNEVESVREGSLAWRAGLRVKTISSLNPDVESTWYVTEVNSRPVSVFSKNGECKQRLMAIGKELSIVVQPTDFVKLLKRQMKLMKRYRDFIVS